MRGRTHSEESKAKISTSMLGKNAGKNNPMHGKISPNRVGVHVCDLEGNKVQSFPSRASAAKYLDVSRPAIIQAIRHGYTLKGAYRVVSSK
ncbi:hypothetical protein BC936DRAFT_142526 [Jimgerdemannia flammicorona]|uniref:Uncharacterized protein n=2 Tax=Jimgerdemannia flammicorona TaxID=994334 RepID=A0A433QFM1_9FUNG|nr:hypothetical protein BC936DRAFT_142526 [Jimgerdemannia flammicorona]RUS28597.1 hypothetical protein BC938DRAFT_481697 [Jimgerdemannia flammicorona]